MNLSIKSPDVSKEFLEKTLKDFYSKEESGKEWENKIVTLPGAVKNIAGISTDRINVDSGEGDAIIDKRLAAKIDHTLLKPDATPDEIKILCNEALKYTFASVCVMPSYVSLCREILNGTEVKVCTVIGFPLGATTTEVKKYEAEQAIKNGALEIDIVINVGQLKHGNYKYVSNDISQVVLTAKKNRVVSKVILETALLTDEEKVKACLICKKAGADFVKTSTGFSKGGATAGDVSLMKFIVGSTMGVKASGGIRSREDAEKMIANGADRIGTSASVKIVLGEKSESSY